MAILLILTAPGDGKYEYGDILAVFEEKCNYVNLFNKENFVLVRVEGTIEQLKWVLEPRRDVKNNIVAARKYKMDMRGLEIYLKTNRKLPSIPQVLIRDKSVIKNNYFYPFGYTGKKN
jgi:hypothetical protein